MIKWFLIVSLAFPVLLTAQDRKIIDSVNNLSYDIKINRAATIDTLFLQNAAAAQKIRYTGGVADSYSNLALVYYYRGKYEQSVSYRLKAIAGYEKTGNRDKLAHEYGELGYAMKRRNMPRAQHYMRKGMAIAEKDSNIYRLSGIYDNYGVLKEMQLQPDSAMLFYHRSLNLKQRQADSVGIPYSLNNIAGVYVMTKRFEQALLLFQQALGIRKRRSDFTGMAESYESIGKLYAEMKQYGKAIESYNKSIECALKSGYIHNVAMGYQNLADIYEKQGMPGLAYDNYKKYVRYKDSLLNKETNSRIAELEVRFETNKKEKMLLEKQAEVRQRNQYIAVISIIAGCIALLGFQLFRQQRLKNRQQAQEHELKTAIAQIETQSQLQEQRLQISRDLHDNIGAQLTFIISSVDNLRYGFGLNETKLGDKLESISGFTRDTIVELRDTIWAMNHNDMGFEDLRGRIMNFIEKAKEAGGDTRFSFSVDDRSSAIRLTSVQGMNIYRAIQEAVNNAIKYSGAATIAVRIDKSRDAIHIVIDDDGRGFNETEVRPGNGIMNMRKRIADIGGTFNIESSPGNGTKITMNLSQMNQI